MYPHLLEWLNLLLRWLHMTVGIAWIGASFYFVWLDLHLLPPDPPKPGILGEVWAIHGGGFYHAEKFRVAPEKIPSPLHWFMWEAYSTWITGFLLLVLMYWIQADVYLLDPNVSSIGKWEAVGLGFATLVLGWLVYDMMCKTRLVQNGLAFAALGFAVACGVAWGLSQVFSARGAYLHVGAMLGTIMAANVAHVIIPSQRELVAAATAGREPDPAFGAKAKKRSLHNNYLTLPVLFVMISHHFPSTYGNAHGWAVLAGLALAGGLIRHWFNLKNQGRKNPWLLPAAAACLLAIALYTAPKAARPAQAAADGGGAGDPGAAVERVPFGVVRGIVIQRCAGCHSATPADAIFAVAPSGVMFDTPEQIRSRAAQIHQRAVIAKTMPLANQTGMTDTERAMIGRWFEQGAELR